MKTVMLLGDEAVAMAALHAGAAGAFSYPGTPATEILEFLERHRDPSGNGGLITSWSTNEKVAYEEALGMSYAGKRSLVSMKHVGLNVAADPFMNSALTGAHGGLVVVVADDPGMHSSQNEQDSRYFAEFAQIPVYEPGSQQDAYYMTLEAFEESERLGLPILIRLVTRLAHSRANVKVLERGKCVAGRGVVKDWKSWTLIPANARVRNRVLAEKYPKLVEESDRSAHNVLKLAGRKGVVCSGIAANYVLECLGLTTDYSILKIAQYPLPVQKLRQMLEHCDEILVVEDGYPFIEAHLSGVLTVAGKTVRGRLTGHLPRTGELDPDVVRAGLGLAPAPAADVGKELPGRPPQLCKGCPHADTYHHVVEALRPYPGAVCFSDIGCYALGALPPYEAIHSCVDMGASIGMARGAALAGVHPSVCAIGDSTFTHSGMTALLGAAADDTNMTVLILDNAIVAMTGGQPTMATGEAMIQLVAGLGVHRDHIRVIDPLAKNHDENVKTIRRELEHRGLSVIVSRRACVQIKRK
jgi:indolepyruvate ferredoxin oxidoreductase alpha subunit